MKQVYFLVLSFLLFLSTNYLVGQDNLVLNEDSLQNELKHQVKPHEVTIIGVGDIMLGTDYPSEKYLPPSNDCSPLLANVKDILKDADVTFGNVEGVFAGDKGTPKECNNPDQCYVFRMPLDYAECIVDAGFDMVSVANNHVNDFGLEGRRNTSKVLSDKGLKFSGFLETPYTIFESNNIKYGLCSFSPHSGTIDMRDQKKVNSIVQTLDTLVDIVIVSFHGGAEGKNHQHVTRKEETFFGNNRGNVYSFAHSVIDAGADVVFGHGPHVTRAIELYKNRLICYSLGNFCTYRRFNLSGPNGYAPIVKLTANEDGEFVKAKIIPIYQDAMGHTRVDPQNRAITKISNLTDEDFPGHNLLIDSNGEISKKGI